MDEEKHQAPRGAFRDRRTGSQADRLGLASSTKGRRHGASSLQPRPSCTRGSQAARNTRRFRAGSRLRREFAGRRPGEGGGFKLPAAGGTVSRSRGPTDLARSRLASDAVGVDGRDAGPYPCAGRRGLRHAMTTKRPRQLRARPASGRISARDGRWSRNLSDGRSRFILAEDCVPVVGASDLGAVPWQAYCDR